ncbi:MAG: hypothetical protein ABH851_03965 [Methanobacteriota archaeon]
MDKPECKTCGMRVLCEENARSWIFFLIGIIATVSIRIIEPLNAVDPIYGKISWYVGVTGFFIFFIYKYRILNKRAKIIKETGLIEKLSNHKLLDSADSILLSQIVCSQTSWKERANFFVIFGLSALALAVALIFEFRN